MEVWKLFSSAWQYLLAGLTLLLSVLGSAHAVLYKRDSRAAVAWVGFIWLVPLVGAVLYFLLGVNRIKRRAVSLRGDLDRYQAAASATPSTPEQVEQELSPDAPHLSTLVNLVDGVVARPAVPGNHLEPLVNGDAAFPAMLAAIEQARVSLALSTYIFDNDQMGRKFADALGRAVARGVEVRVLIDDAGARYSWPSIIKRLRGAGVCVARFHRTFAPFQFMAMNMRNHRKLLIADGRIGFTGGINIRAGHALADKPAHPVQDLHFRVAGPVVAEMQEVFADDWLFTTGEPLRDETWFPRLEFCGDMIARGIPDGPDEDFEKLRWTLLGALSCARKSVTILTPYFLPDQALVSALNVAAMRGVAVNLILPGRNNLPFVQWATFAMLWQVLERGCRVWLTPPPFDHTKMLIVDGHWSLIGSANWDPRSLRLNFEFNLECYDRAFAEQLEQLAEAKRRAARPLTLEEVDARSLPIRLRDGLARLFSPYL